MAHNQERNTRAIRVIIEQDAGFVAWLSDQFGTIRKRFDKIETLINQLETTMSAQTDKLIADVTALIDEAMTDIAKAIAAAQNQSPDPAIDALDAKVTETTQKLKDAMVTLNPAGQPVPPSPAPTPPAGGL